MATRKRVPLTNDVTPANGQIPIGNGTDYTVATLTGTTNQITITNASGSITLSLPQNITTTASPQFQRLGVGIAQSGVSSIGIAAGSTVLAPIHLTSGGPKTTAVIGDVEFATDDLFFTITTSTARKRLLMADPAGGLTSGRLAIGTTNGRVTDDSGITAASGVITTTGLVVGTSKISSYNGVATQGLGVPAIYKVGRLTAQTAAQATVVTYTPTADGTFLVSANVLVTTATLHNFTVTCTYTDEGNTARTLTLTFSNIGGTLLTGIINTAGAVPYEGIPLHIRAKANTSITIGTTGSFTTVTYNVEGVIQQLA